MQYKNALTLVVFFIGASWVAFDMMAIWSSTAQLMVFAVVVTNYCCLVTCSDIEENTSGQFNIKS